MTLSFNYLCECLSYDESTGLLFWLARPGHHFVTARACNVWNARYAGKKAGCVNNSGRVALKIDGRGYLAHRVIWAIIHGMGMADVPDEIDHRDVNPLNNKRDNLRAETHSENQHNRRAYATNKSGFKGVSWHKASSTWVAQIGMDSTRRCLGFFPTPEQAHDAYLAAANDNYGAFARAA